MSDQIPAKGQVPQDPTERAPEPGQPATVVVAEPDIWSLTPSAARVVSCIFGGATMLDSSAPLLRCVLGRPPDHPLPHPPSMC